MRGLATLTAAAALALAVGFTGPAQAEVVFPFDGDLVGYWHFDTNAGTADAVDGSGNGNDGDLKNGATRSTDIPVVINNVNSVELDGTDDFVEIADPGVGSALDQSGDFTIAAWVALDPGAGANSLHPVVTKDTAAFSQNYNLHAVNGNFAGFVGPVFVVSFTAAPGVGVVSSGTGNCALDFCALGGASAFVDGGGGFPLGTWRHIAGAYDDTAKTLKVYLDGVLEGEMSVTGGGSPKVNDDAVLIGTRTSIGEDTKGLIDDVRIYDVALTDLEVAALASAGAIVVNDDTLDGSAPCEFPDFSIVQDGIDAVSDELKTVLVCPGTYVEDLDIFTDGVTLVGDDMSTSIIEGATVHGGAGPAFPFCDGPPIDLQANGVTIENLTINTPVTATDERTCGLIIDGVDNEIADIYFNVGIGAFVSVAIQTWVAGSEAINDISGLHIHDNNFTNLASLNGGLYDGVFINPQSDPEATDNPVVIENNDLSGEMFFGITVSSRGNTELSDNTVNGAIAGIVLEGTADGNLVEDNSTGFSSVFGIFILTDDNDILGNSAHHGAVGIELDGDGNDVLDNAFHTNTGDGVVVTGDNNDILDNSIHHNGGDGIEVTADGTGNTFEGNNSHHNTDSAYLNDGGATNCFDNAGADRNKAKKNDGNNDIPDGPGGASSC